MRDPIAFARLISQITHVTREILEEFTIKEIAVTVDSFSAGASISSINQLLAAMRDGRKIEAIKEYRSLTGMGLKESKDAVEMYWNPIPSHAMAT